MAEHLLSLGHSSMAFVTMASLATSSVAARYSGFKTAVEMAGHPTPQVLVCSEEASAVSLLKTLVGGAESATAVLAVRDSIASELISATRVLGPSVPDDISIAGFDDSDLASRLSAPLTSVDPDAAGIGEVAGRLLIEKHQAWASGAAAGLPIRNIQMRPTLVVRSSSGPAKTV